MSIDLFLCGPSCKDLSTLNVQRKDFAGSYMPDQDGQTFGSSGITYVHGYKKARISFADCYHLECIPSSLFIPVPMYLIDCRLWSSLLLSLHGMRTSAAAPSEPRIKMTHIVSQPLRLVSGYM